MHRTILALGALLLPWPALADGQCGERAEVIRQLDGRYAEQPVALGIAENGGVIEVLAAPQGETWTIVITMPNGITCMLAAGEDWERIPRVAMAPAA